MRETSTSQLMPGLLRTTMHVAVTAHFETQGQPITIVLDIVEVPKVSASKLSIACYEHHPSCILE